MTKRAYKRFDPLAMALEQVGDRWTLFVVRALMNRPQRYVDLRAYLSGAGSNVLGERLRQLADQGIITRRTGDRPGAATTYHLTERGWALSPVIDALVRFGLGALLLMGAPGSSDAEAFDQSWAIPDPDLIADETYQWTVDGTDLVLDVRVAGLQIVRHRGVAQDPAAALTTTSSVLESILSRRRTMESAIAAGDLTLAGPPQAIGRMFTAIGFTPPLDIGPSVDRPSQTTRQGKAGSPPPRKGRRAG